MRPEHPPLPNVHPLASGIAFEFADDYLELLRLLVEAAGLEHSLMLSYLYAMFSLREEHAAVGGDLSTLSYLQNTSLGPGGTNNAKGPTTLLAIAIEEMQHLSLVNKLMCALGGAPHVVPHGYPISSDLYPFPITLRPLDRTSAATYLWLEAATGLFSTHPAADGMREDIAIVDAVLRTLGDDRCVHHHGSLPREQVSHVGSIYRVVLRQLRKVAERPPAFIDSAFPWGEWEQRMIWVMGQGELAHYQFFRSIFTGEAFSNEGIWSQGICQQDFTWKTAYPGRTHTIRHDGARRLAWLSNLHYWVILCALDLAFRAGSHRLRYTAIDHMTTSLWRLGRHLARDYRVGLPFDAMSSRYTLGRDAAMTRAILTRLVEETERHARALDKDGLLPSDYDPSQFTLTMHGLQSLEDGGEGRGS